MAVLVVVVQQTLRKVMREELEGYMAVVAVAVWVQEIVGDIHEAKLT
jgi:hypothetical protein